MVEAIKRDARPCPDPETIAAFLDGRLSGRERAQVVEHLADCADCYFIFSESARMPAASDAAKEPSSWRRWIGQPMVLWPSVAALAAAAALAVTVGSGVMPWRLSSRQELQALVAAVGTERTFEPRLTGGFAYGAVKVVRGAESAATMSPDVRIVAAQIDKTAQAHRTPDALHMLGISYLVMGDAAHAVPVLEEAANRPSADPHMLNDLAVAYLVRASHGGEPADYAKALTLTDRAVKSDPGMVEAWFNRAIAVSHVSGNEETRHAWEDYLRVDSTSAWSSEANAHLHSLNESSR